MTTFDLEAKQLLRHAVQIAGSRPVTLADLRRARNQPTTEALPESQLRADKALTAVLRRATALAEARASEAVGRTDVLEALAEAEAVEAGLDLDRLRFARWRLARTYAEPPQARMLRAETPVGS